MPSKIVELPDSRYGKIFAFQDDLISDFLIEYGEWAYLETLFINSVLPSKFEKFFDLGAYVGTFALGLSKLRPESSTVCAELNSHAFQLLVQNISGSDSNIIAHNILVGNCNKDDVNIYVQSELANAGSLKQIDAPDGHQSESISVNVRTIPNISKSTFIPDFIKLDLEGSELDALIASQEWLNKNRPWIWLECNESPIVIDIFKLLIWLGYEIYYFTFPSFNTANYNRSEKRIFPFAHEAGLLAFNQGYEVDIAEEFKDLGCFGGKVRNIYELKKFMWKTPRWGLEEWGDISLNELIGILSHMKQGLSFSTFLE